MQDADLYPQYPTFPPAHPGTEVTITSRPTLQADGSYKDVCKVECGPMLIEGLEKTVANKVGLVLMSLISAMPGEVAARMICNGLAQECAYRQMDARYKREEGLKKRLAEIESGKLWIVGQYRDAEPKIGQPATWEFSGVFSSEAAAVAACQSDSYFIAPATLDAKHPDHPSEWTGLRYPHLDKSEPALERLAKVAREAVIIQGVLTPDKPNGNGHVYPRELVLKVVHDLNARAHEGRPVFVFDHQYARGPQNIVGNVSSAILRNDDVVEHQVTLVGPSGKALIDAIGKKEVRLFGSFVGKFKPGGGTVVEEATLDSMYIAPASRATAEAIVTHRNEPPVPVIMRTEHCICPPEGGVGHPQCPEHGDDTKA